RPAGPRRETNKSDDFWTLRPVTQRLNEAAQFIGVGHALDHVGAAEHAELFKLDARRRDGIESIAFLPELANGDTHGYLVSRPHTRTQARNMSCPTSTPLPHDPSALALHPRLSFASRRSSRDDTPRHRIRGSRRPVG